jgi:membrane-associated phospholipid phosphatase
MHSLFYKIAETVGKIYSGPRLKWQLVAVLLTAILVMSGFDWWWYTKLHTGNFQVYLFPAVIFGGAAPFLVPAGFLLVGYFQKRIRTTLTALALVQAQLLGVTISTMYKAFTGRIPPEVWGNTLQDISNGFQLGFLKGGIFWGWPSSHTTVAFAGALTLFVLYRDKKWVQVIVLLYALYIGIGISSNIHWFSEFVAGAVIGSVIGLCVGKAFLYRLHLHTA